MMDNFMANQVMLAYAASASVGEEDPPPPCPEEDGGEAEEEGGASDPTIQCDQSSKGNNIPFWGNQQTMNLNPLIWTNITGSPYFKVNLFGLKTYHEVIDEIYYKVSHLEPWERGSRKTSGQTGMCGGVRGVGAGGIVSSAYCLLYKLFTLKLTRKQVNGMLNHCDSPYIRGLGFMYIRYTQPPGDLWNWFEGYLDDEEEIDCKAGGGKQQTVGDMCRQMLTKLEWFDTRFPRIPVNTQKLIDEYLEGHFGSGAPVEPEPIATAAAVVVEKYPKCLPPLSGLQEDRGKSSSSSNSSRKRSKHSSRDKHRRSRSRDRNKSSPSRHRSSHHKSRRQSPSREKSRRHKSDRDYEESRTSDYQDELRRYSEHRKKSKSRRRSRSRERR